MQVPRVVGNCSLILTSKATEVVSRQLQPARRCSSVMERANDVAGRKTKTPSRSSAPAHHLASEQPANHPALLRPQANALHVDVMAPARLVVEE
jgi:hypothetical protein